MPLGRGTWDGDRQVKATSWCQLPEGFWVMSGLGRIAAPDSAGSVEELEKLVSGQARLSQDRRQRAALHDAVPRGITVTRPSRFRYTA